MIISTSKSICSPEGELHRQNGMLVPNIIGHPESLEFYRYVRNNPINNIDPSGQWTYDYKTGDITIQSGDTISEIALELTGTLDYNHVLTDFSDPSDPDKIRPNDVIHLATDITLVAVTEDFYNLHFRSGPAWSALGQGEIDEPSEKDKAKAPPVAYQVQEGDTLGSISFALTGNSLNWKLLNYKGNPRRLCAGKWIDLPPAFQKLILQNKDLANVPGAPPTAPPAKTPDLRTPLVTPPAKTPDSHTPPAAPPAKTAPNAATANPQPPSVAGKEPSGSPPGGPADASKLAQPLGEFLTTQYNKALESDYPAGPKVDAPGLNAPYSQRFLEDVIMQGSGIDATGRFIQIDWAKKATKGENLRPLKYVDHIRTASGAPLTEKISVAVDPSVIPLGTWIYIESVGWRRADDTGRKINNKHIDIFVNEPRAEAKNWRFDLNVWVLP